mmetsp:Transcript_79906/g.224290  ORF Transcript_79906/g.224290 Transcript_79906/m.224290 type:complete len:222 (+) Transcript_79906:53-718(+)
MRFSASVFSLARRLPSCLLLERTCSVLAMRSWKLWMAKLFFFNSASISASLVCASKSSSRMDLPSPSPSAWGAAFADMPAVSACMDHCAFSISRRVVASSAARTSNFSCSFFATFSFCSACFRRSAMAALFCFWLSMCACRSDSLFFSLDSQDATSLASLEWLSSRVFNSCERCESLVTLRSFNSLLASFSRRSNALTASTKDLSVFSMSSNCWFLFSNRF